MSVDIDQAYATSGVFLDVFRERVRQIELGWTPEHDGEHGAAHLVHLALDRLVDEPRLPLIYKSPRRADLIQVAALLVAAIEVIDRKEKT